MPNTLVHGFKVLRAPMERMIVSQDSHDVVIVFFEK
jgi:hypothetical protein